MITLDELKKFLLYDPKIGSFIWLISRGKVKYGNVAGFVEKDGYRRIRIKGKSYQANVLAWFYMTGDWPKNYIDHKNRNKDDNRFDNLREATNQENQRNRGIPKNNTSGCKGVLWCKPQRKWRAQIYVDGKIICLLYTDYFEEAVRIRREAEFLYFGEFAEVS